MKKNISSFILIFSICSVIFSQNSNVLYNDGMAGVYISDYNTDKSCVTIMSSDGYAESHLGGAVRKWKLEISYSDKVELNFEGFTGAESRRSYGKMKK